MEKKLKAELVSLAHRILQLKNQDVHELKREAQRLYEALSVLAFAKANLSDPEEVQHIIHTLSDDTMQAIPAPVKVQETPPPTSDAPLTPKETTEITKDIPASKPVEEIEQALQDLLPKKDYMKNDMEELASSYGNLPEFERKTTINDAPRGNRLNDNLHRGFKVGMNARMGYIKHLFNGDAGGYQRVISQLETFENLQEARDFLNHQVKPDYNHWEGKEDYADRFMALVERNYN